MGRLYIALGGAAILMVLLISSATNGMLSRIPNCPGGDGLPWLEFLCGAAWAGWFYLNGGFDHLAWLEMFLVRPETEIRFVSFVENQMNSWADAHPGGEGACQRATEAIDVAASKRPTGAGLWTQFTEWAPGRCWSCASAGTPYLGPATMRLRMPFCWNPGRTCSIRPYPAIG